MGFAIKLQEEVELMGLYYQVNPQNPTWLKTPYHPKLPWHLEIGIVQLTWD